jgi:hypoxanthine phosphoribosyltransferase
MNRMQDAAPGRIAWSAAEISARVDELARAIDRDFEGKDLVLVCVLKGSLYFFADLTRAIRIPIRLDFIAISGFAPADPTSGAVRIVKDLDADIAGKHVLLVEDIVRTGLTTAYLVQTLETRRPASVRVCSLLVNPSQLMINVPIAYQGFEVSTRRLIGYGMDIGEQGRNLPDISEVERPQFP